MVGDILRLSRRRRKKRRMLRVFIFLFFFAVIFAGLVYVSYLPRFRVRSLSFSGLESINQEKAENITKSFLASKRFLFLPADSIFILPSQQLKKELSANFLKIKDIIIDKDYSGFLNIKIKERQLWAILCSGEEASSCFYADDQGFLFQKAPVFNGNVIRRFLDLRGNNFGPGNTFLEPGQLNKIKYFVDKYESVYGGKITEVILEPEGIYKMQTDKGWDIIIDSQTGQEEAFENMQIALSSEIKEKADALNYIDLRFGNKIYYKFK